MPSVKQTVSLTDEAIKALPFAEHAKEFYYVKDSDTKGLLLRVGVEPTKTFRFESERREDGKRIGISRSLGEWPDVRAREARKAAESLLGKRAENKIGPGVRQGGSFDDGMAKYIVHLRAKAKKQKKPASWADNVEALNDKHMKPKWTGKTLMWLASNQQAVEDWHTELGKSAPVSANHACRIIRAMYRHACKYNHQLPRDRHPVETVKWNDEDPRGAAMPFDQFPSWAKAVAAIPNDARRAFHMLNLLTGARPGELARLAWDDVHPKKRQLFIRKSKTGNDIPIPMSWPIVRELRRARSYARAEGYQGSYVFPSIRGGHIRRFDSDNLTHYANALRGTFKTVATDLEIDDIVSGALMGHTPKGISQKYIGRLVLASGVSLPAAQKKISARICKLLNA
jgi:integrase